MSFYSLTSRELYDLAYTFNRTTYSIWSPDSFVWAARIYLFMCTIYVVGWESVKNLLAQGDNLLSTHVGGIRRIIVFTAYRMVKQCAGFRSIQKRRYNYAARSDIYVVDNFNSSDFTLLSARTRISIDLILIESLYLEVEVSVLLDKFIPLFRIVLAFLFLLCFMNNSALSN